MKDSKRYTVKTFDLKIEDVDVKNRKVVGYLSAFNILDSDNDIIRKGAFAKSITERGPEATSNRKIAHLRNHSWEEQIGKFLELEEDDTGLRFVSQLGRSTKGSDALLDYQDGILREHSIGFNYIEDKITPIDKEDTVIFEITEVKLWEGSSVTFGANEYTPVIDVSKGMDKDLVLNTINSEMDVYIKALKSGGTDDRLYNIEMGLKILKEKYNSLILYKPVEKITSEDKPNEAKELMLNILKK